MSLVQIPKPVQLDLGVADVHQPSAESAPKRTRKMATLPTKTRNALPSRSFALPSQRKYPLPDANHVRNAAARLEQEKKAGKISDADYATAKRNIARAERKFGIKSGGSKAAKKKTGGIHVRADLAHGGVLHVRQLTDEDRTVLVEGAAVALADDDAKPVWIQLAKTGTFKGHPAGPFELNEKVFSEIVRNFKATQNQSIPIDFEHASEAEPTEGSIPVEGAPAQGWIRDLKIDGGNLWGLVEWGQKAREYIRAGQYKFFSPAIRFGARDRVTGQQIGARMTSGALTNNPFLDGMRPLAAKDAGGDGAGVSVEMRSLAHAPGEYMPVIRAALRMPDLCSARECSDQLGRLRDHFDAAGGDADGSHEGIALSSYLYPLRSLVGARPGDTWDRVLDIIDDLIDAAIGETEGADMDDGGDDAEMTDATSGADGSVTITGNDAQENEDMDLAKQLADASAKNAELSISLKDGEKKLEDTGTKLKDAETKVADLTLSLKDESAKRETAETELKELRDWREKREAKDLDDRVEEAFQTYKDAHKLTDADKETMLIVLKAKPEAFEKKYPKVPADKKHLQRNLTEHREIEAPKLMGDDGGEGAQVIDLRSAAKALSAQKGIPLDVAQRIVMSNTPKKGAR